MMSTCYCIKNASKHYRVRESMCVREERVSAGERGEERNQREQEEKGKKGRGEKDAAQQAEGKVNAPAEENVL